MSVDALVGKLTLRPGAAEPIVCERPMVGLAMMRSLTEGRRASLLPELVGTVFTLCASSQRSTSRRAVCAALGLHDEAAQRARDGLVIGLTTAREHLQRLALDIPTIVPCDSARPDPGWLRDAPVMSLPANPAASGDVPLHEIAHALPAWLERRLLGMPVVAWLDGWTAGGGAWLARWCAGHEHPVTRWLRAVRDDAEQLAIPCRPLDVLDQGESGMGELAAALAADTAFAERPLWHGAPAETGPWTRHRGAEPAATVWDRLGGRIADLLHIAHGDGLAFGASSPRDGEGIAWTEMSRGLLVHWLRLEPGARSADTGRAESYRVLAPTEWNFHPDGALAQALRRDLHGEREARLAAASLDPCIAFDVAPEAGHA